MVNVLCYDSGDESDFVYFEDFNDTKFQSSTNSYRPGGISYNHAIGILPQPKFASRNDYVNVPKPVDVIRSEYYNDLLNQKKEEEAIVHVDAGSYKQQFTELARENAIIQDTSLYRGVGRHRHMSQLKYLADIDSQSRGVYEQMVKNETRARVKANRVYGW